MTGGEYFQAEDAEALSDVLLDLPSSIELQQQDIEITGWFALAGAVLILEPSGCPSGGTDPARPAPNHSENSHQSPVSRGRSACPPLRTRRTVSRYHSALCLGMRAWVA